MDIVQNLVNPVVVREMVQRWLLEDMSPLDVGGAIASRRVSAVAELRCKTDTVLAGRPFVDALFRELDCSVEWNFQDGHSLQAPCIAATVAGPTQGKLHVLAQ